MECNKDEARKAMDIAEVKISDKDYNGAQFFAKEAQRLYPNHDGLKQLMTTIEVYISGETKVAGEADWYGILHVDPCAADEVLKKQYRKLALILHPDKNKCKGANGAFQLLSEAWSFLSDTSKRLLYNKKRGLEPPVMVSSPFVPKQNGSLTFWTKCDKCGARHELFRIYLNLTMVCPKCHVSFCMKEMILPSNSRRSPNNSSGTSGKEPAQSRRAHANSQKATKEDVNVAQHAEGKLKRGFEESQETDAAARGSTNYNLRNGKRPDTGDKGK